jgi:ATP-binding cassette subfamily A (ABC1) protein 3
MVDYLSRGYETLHNLAANVVLKIELDDVNAKISLLTAPMPPTNDKEDSF